MGLVEIVLIAVSLSMDAFAVSITLGFAAPAALPAGGRTRGTGGAVFPPARKFGIKQYLIPGVYFGFFQALMPFIGFFAGTYFAQKIQNLDHWIAFVLLGIIGGKMIKDSFSIDEETGGENPFQFLKMLLLAVATSIDALAIGVTFAFFKINIFTAIIITGLTTFCISMGGVKVGKIFGARFKSKAEFAGGAVLVILGIKILVEHLFFT